MKGPRAASEADDALSIAQAIGLLRSGASPAEAWREAFDVAVSADGAPMIDPSRPAARSLASAGRLARRTGAPLSDVLEAVGGFETARARAELARKAALAGPQASVVLLLWMPVAGWALATAVDPRSLGVLFRSALGWALLAAGGALWWSGRRWISVMTASARAAGADVGARALPLALAEAALAAGLDVASSIAAVASAIGGPEGEILSGVARRLRGGSGWDTAWSTVEAGHALEPPLRAAWSRGAAPLPTLRAARDAALDRAAADGQAAAAELGVRAALPLALCLLPSFVLVGVVPLVLTVARGAMGSE